MYHTISSHLLKRLFCFLLLSIALPVFGQDCSLQKLTASDALGGDMMGRSVSIGKIYAIVGVTEKDNSQGRAYIYKFDGTAWQQTAILSGSENTPYRGFGTSVYIDDEFAIIGTNTQSYVYVFKREGDVWTEKAILTGDGRSSNPFDSESFGSSLDMEGDLLIVGAYSEDTRGIYSAGAAYIFKRNDNTGTSWSRQAKFAPQELAYHDGFGYSVSISGTTAIVTSAYDGTFENNTPGAAYIFERKGNSWVQQVKLKTKTKHANGLFGMDSDVFLHPQTGERIALVGNDSWGVHVYKYVNESWRQTQFIGDSTKVTGGRFAFSVDMQDNELLIGQPYSSAAWLYTYNQGKFDVNRRLEAPDVDDYQQFGHQVALSKDGSAFIVGAIADNEKGERAGAAYLQALVKINPLPVLCSQGMPVIISAYPKGGTWKGRGISNSSTGEFSPALAGIGKHQVIYEYKNSVCTMRDTTEVEVKDKPASVHIAPVSALLLCQGEPIELTAIALPGQDFTWQYSPTKEGNFTDAPGENTLPIYQANKLGFYRLESRLQDCVSSFSEAIYVQELYVKATLASTPFCKGTTTELSITETNGSSYQWYYSSDPTKGYMEASRENTLLTYQAGKEGYYFALSTLNDCTASSDTLEVKESFLAVSIVSPAAVCEGSQPFQLKGNPASGIWIGKGISDTGLFNPQLAGAGKHSITYLVKNQNCEYRATTIVEVKPLPQVFLESKPTLEFCLNERAVVKVTSIPNAVYSWEYAVDEKSDFTGVAASNSSTFPATMPGLYRVKVNQAGCIAYSPELQLVDLKDSTAFPNVFTPNGDGANDTFEPYIENASYYELEIYNRLGKKVYASSGVTNQWDGKGYPTGVYYWLVRYNMVCNKEVKELKGIVSILY